MLYGDCHVNWGRIPATCKSPQNTARGRKFKENWSKKGKVLFVQFKKLIQNQNTGYIADLNGTFPCQKIK